MFQNVEAAPQLLLRSDLVEQATSGVSGNFS